MQGDCKLNKREHLLQLARAGLKGKYQTEKGRRMSDDEEKECKMEEGGSSGRQDREVSDCFTNRIPLINHPV